MRKQFLSRRSPSSDKLEDVAKQTAFGAAWLVVSRLLTRVIDIATFFIVARLLSPSDFGVIAVAMTLILVVEAVLQLPVGQVLIRLPSLDSDDLDTAFTLALTRALLLGVAVAALAWPFAVIYNNPALFGLILALSISPASRGLVSPEMIHFSRRLDFRPYLYIEVFGKLCAFVVTVCLALGTASYWAIVVGTIISPTAMMIASYVLAPYKPKLSLKRWRTFAEFLGWTSAAQVVTAINWQCDRLLLGRFTTQSELGVFSIASELSTMPLQVVVMPMTPSVMAAFATLDGDRHRLGLAYQKAASGIMIVGMPAMIGLALFAEPAIRLALGERWIAAAPLLQWLALSVIPELFVAPLGPLAMVLNKTKIFFRLSVAEMFIKVSLVAFGAVLLGTAGVVAARLISSCAMALLSMAYVHKLIGITIWRQIIGQYRIVVSACVMVVVAFLLRPWVMYSEDGFLLVRLLIVIAVSALAYASAILSLWQIAGRPAGVEALASNLVVNWSLSFRKTGVPPGLAH